MRFYHVVTKVSPTNPHFEVDKVIHATNARVAINKALRDLPDLDSFHSLRIIVRRT